MAFTLGNMRTFSTRMQNLMLMVQNVREEAARLDSIYVQEALSGSDPQFVDTPIATAQEHIDAIVFFRAFKDFVENGEVSQADRVANITPFIQVD